MLKNPRIAGVNKNMKKIFSQNFTLGFLVLAASTLSLIFVQQQVLAVWQAPNANPGDNTPVSVPLTVDASNNVDVANNNLINVADLEVDTLTVATSIDVLGTLTAATLNAPTFQTDAFSMPLGSGQATVNIVGVDSSIDLTAANAVSIGVVTKAGKFSSGIAASGGISYGVYADTNASSGGLTNYAIAGVSNNAGGVAVYGLANAGWAGYFSGPVGIAGSLAVGNNITASGAYAFASGANIEASGDHSFAVGDSSVASGAEAVAFGFAAEASAGSSFAAGNEAMASGFGATALGWNAIASGIQSLALGYSARASAENAIALGSITVSGIDSLGVNLDSGFSQTFSQANSMAIMGGNLGINTTAPSYKLHLVGDFYQDGMMQVRPTTALLAAENIFYGNAPSGSNNSANLLLLQNNGVDKFKVTALGTGTFASSISATQGSFSSGLSVSGAVATINAGATVSGTLGMKSGGIISFNSSKGSYFDFNDDDGTGAPACAAGTAGVVYNFKVNNVLCYCNGTAWFSMVNGKADAFCSNK